MGGKRGLRRELKKERGHQKINSFFLGIGIIFAIIIPATLLLAYISYNRPELPEVICETCYYEKYYQEYCPMLSKGKWSENTDGFLHLTMQDGTKCFKFGNSSSAVCLLP